MKKIIALAVVASAAVFAGKDVIPAPSEPIAVTPPPAPETTSHGLGLKISTLGVGVDLEHFFNEKHALRFNPNYLKITRDDEEIEGINYDAELKLQNAGLIYDYHPWGTSFRVSTGVYYNGNKLTATARPSSTETYTIGNHEYQLDSQASIDAKVDFKKVAPYVGFGWSSTEKNGWHLIADIGVMYVGSPKVDYKVNSATGKIKDLTLDKEVSVNSTILNEQIDKEAAEIKDEIEDYKWWPVISIGIQKKF